MRTGLLGIGRGLVDVDLERRVGVAAGVWSMTENTLVLCAPLYPVAGAFPSCGPQASGVISTARSLVPILSLKWVNGVSGLFRNTVFT